MNRIVYYRGDRIDLRPLELEDEPLLRRWINDPDTWATLGHRSPINATREREWIENYGKEPGEYIFGIVVRESNQLIGTAGLHGTNGIDRKATFGLMIGEHDARGRGYGSETTRLLLRFGFEELNLNRIELTVFAHNHAAIRVYEKAGYVREGRKRETFYRNGRYRDVYVYAVLRSDYDRIRQTAGAQTDAVSV